jgi:hypothetical protein
MGRAATRRDTRQDTRQQNRDNGGGFLNGLSNFVDVAANIVSEVIPVSDIATGILETSVRNNVNNRSPYASYTNTVDAQMNQQRTISPSFNNSAPPGSTTLTSNQWQGDGVTYEQYTPTPRTVQIPMQMNSSTQSGTQDTSSSGYSAQTGSTATPVLIQGPNGQVVQGTVIQTGQPTPVPNGTTAMQIDPTTGQPVPQQTTTNCSCTDPCDAHRTYVLCPNGMKVKCPMSCMEKCQYKEKMKAQCACCPKYRKGYKSRRSKRSYSSRRKSYSRPYSNRRTYTRSNNRVMLV